MRCWTKICGLTDARAVSCALDAGADALGFVLSPSVRRIEPEVARKLAEPARGRAVCIAVLRDPDAALWQRMLDVFRPDAVQTDARDFVTHMLPDEVRALPVYRDGGETPDAVAPSSGWLLYESAVSGSGTLADWRRARALAARGRLVLAGGLSPDNVAAAVAAVRPWGVDVSSGVESEPGIKDCQRIGAFVAAVRAAEESMTCN